MSIFFRQKNPEPPPIHRVKKKIGWKQSKNRMFSDPKMQISSLPAELVEQGPLYYHTKQRILWKQISQEITIDLHQVWSPQYG